MMKGQRVLLVTNQEVTRQTEEGMETVPLVHEGIFVHADGDDIYINTATDDPNAFCAVVNRKSYRYIEIATEQPDDPVTNASLLN